MILRVIFIISLFASIASAEDRPASYSIDRYSVIWKQSMFSKTTTKEVPNSSIYWTLAGVFTFEGGTGAMIVNQATGGVEQVEMDKRNESGLIMIDKIHNPRTGAVSVKIDQNGKTFWVSKMPTGKQSQPISGDIERLAGRQSQDSSLRKAVASAE